MRWIGSKASHRPFLGAGARILDISPRISPELRTWPGDPRVEIERVASLGSGDGYNLSLLSMSVHAGAHVDAPLHYLEDGAGADALDLSAMVGPARLFEIVGSSPIGAATLDGLEWPKGLERVLFKTRGEPLERSDEASGDETQRGWGTPSSDEGRPAGSIPLGYYEPFSALDASGARWLVERGVRAVGIDSPSIATLDGLEEAHRVLLTAGTIPIEGLDFGTAVEGDYLLVCLPLKLAGADGAPARAILIEAG